MSFLRDEDNIVRRAREARHHQPDRLHELQRGQGVEISRREPGEYFGEIALLQNRPRTAPITASVDTGLLSLRAEQFQELTSHFMQLSATISRSSSRRLSFVEAARSRTIQNHNA